MWDGRGALLAVTGACVAMFWLVASAVYSGPRLTVQTPGVYAMAPADWWVRVRVEPNAENRWLEVIADGTEHYRGTGFMLDGEHAPAIHQWWLKALPAGCYEITATIRATDEHGPILAFAKGRKLSVMGAMIEGDPCA